MAKKYEVGAEVGEIIAVWANDQERFGGIVKEVERIGEEKLIVVREVAVVAKRLPVSPVIPVGPVKPVLPVDPCGPLGPIGPREPVGP